MEHKFKGIETRIEGLDNILDGGIPQKNQVLITGGPGMGKTLMSFEILYNCAKNSIPCAFVALDQKPENIVKNIRNTFTNKTDLDELIKKRMLVIDGYDTASKIATNTELENAYSMGNLVSEIGGIIKSVEAQVVVVDSLSFLKLMLGKTPLYNKTVSSLIAMLRRAGTTSILTLGTPYYSRKKMKFGQELLLFDGALALYREDVNKVDSFVMEVVKMRGNSHDRALSHYSITEAGIVFK